MMRKTEDLLIDLISACEVLLLFGEVQDFSEKATPFLNTERALFRVLCERNLQRARCDQILEYFLLSAKIRKGQFCDVGR